jgi:hypothetical protein
MAEGGKRFTMEGMESMENTEWDMRKYVCRKKTWKSVRLCRFAPFSLGGRDALHASHFLKWLTKSSEGMAKPKA